MSCELSIEDFDIFWRWIAFTSKGRPVAKRADTHKLHRIFKTLDMFETHGDEVAFVKSWECVNEDYVTSSEMKIGLTMLQPAQNQHIMRFIAALRVKEQEDAAKEKEAEKIRRVASRTKMHGIETKMALEIEGEPDERTGTNESGDSVAEAIVTEEEFGARKEGSSKNRKTSNDIRHFKETHGLNSPKNSSISPVERVVGYVKSLSRTFSQSFRVSTSKGCRINPETSPRSEEMESVTHKDLAIDDNKNDILIQSRSDDHDDMRSVRSEDELTNRSVRSEDGFTNRLSMANLLIYRQEKWGDEQSRSYRVEFDDEYVNPFSGLEDDDDDDEDEDGDDDINGEEESVGEAFLEGFQ